MERVELKPYRNYKESEILALYEGAGWSNYYDNPKMLRDAYGNSLFALGAYSGSELIGIIRVVGDGASIIYIQDIIVAPAYQRKGIGKRLVQSILQKYDHVYQTVLMTDSRPQTLNFYKQMGFDTAKSLGCTAFLRFTIQ